MTRSTRRAAIPSAEPRMADFLREAREKAGLRQKDVSDALGYGTAQFISNWERGLRQPSCQTLWKIAELYGVSAESLYELMLHETIARIDRQLREEFLQSKPKTKRARRA